MMFQSRSLHMSRLLLACGLLVGLTAGCGSDDEDAAVIGVWRIVGYGADGELAAPVEASEPTLAFSEDGILQILAGCNTGLTSWAVDGARLSVGLIAQTAMACPEPPGVMEQEQAISTLVEQATEVEVDGETLRLLTDDVVTVEAQRP